MSVVNVQTVQKEIRDTIRKFGNSGHTPILNYQGLIRVRLIRGVLGIVYTTRAQDKSKQEGAGQVLQSSRNCCNARPDPNLLKRPVFGESFRKLACNF